MINKIWFCFIFCGIVFGILSGNIDKVNSTIIDSTTISLDMLLKIFPVLALWMGLMNIASKSGLLEKISKNLSPLLTKLFPDIPRGHESFSLIASNIIANIFGLGSAATPFGIKAMNSLQTLNKDKTKASKSMITFLVINTSGLTIVPTTIISLRLMYKSIDPSSIVFACIISTLVSTVGSLIINSIVRRCYKD